MDRSERQPGEAMGHLLRNFRARRHRQLAGATATPAPARSGGSAVVIDLSTGTPSACRGVDRPPIPSGPQPLGWAWGPAAEPETDEGPGVPAVPPGRPDAAAG